MTGSEHDFDEKSIDLATFYAVLKKHFEVIALITVISLTLSGMVSFFYLLPVYESKTMIMLTQTPGSPEAYKSAMNTYVGQVNSEVLMHRVITKLNLKQQDFSTTKPLMQGLFNQGDKQAINPVSLSRLVEAAAVKDSHLIEITVSNKDAKTAALMADTLSREFILMMKEINQDIVNQSIESVHNQITSVQQLIGAAADPVEKQLYADTLTLLNDRIRAIYSNDLQNIGMVIATPALVPEKPVSPNKALNMVLALFAGIVFSLCLIFIKEALNNKINTYEEVSRHLDLPVLGIILHAGRHARQQE